MVSKLAEFEFFFEGWYADPYIAENFTVLGKFDVKITIDKPIVLGGHGLQNKK
jgi:hypothetical protein